MIEAYKRTEYSKECQAFDKNISKMIHNITEEQAKDKDLIVSIMMIDTAYIFYADDSLKKDREFGLIVAENFPFSISLLDPILAQDKEIVLKSIENGNYLRNIGKELRTSSDIIKAYDKRTADIIRDREEGKSIDLSRA